MIDSSNIKTNIKALANRRRTLYQHNNIKINEMKKDIIKNLSVWKTTDIKPITVKNIKNVNFDFKKDNHNFTPRKVSSNKFIDQINDDVDFIFHEMIKISQSPNKTLLQKSKLPKLNVSKIYKNHKEVLRINDFLILESQYSNVNNNSLDRKNIKQLNEKLIEQLRKYKFEEENEKENKVTSKINKKNFNKNHFKTYDRVLGLKFSHHHYNNIISKKNNIKNSNNKNSSTQGELNKSYDDLSPLNSKDMASPKTKNHKNTYLTAIEQIDHNISISSAQNSVNASPMNHENIKTKIEKLKKGIHFETNGNLSYEKNSITKSRSSSNKSNPDKNFKSLDIENYNNNNSLHSPFKKPQNNILDSYVRLPNILYHKLNLNESNSQSNINNSKLIINSNLDLKKLDLRKFNKTKKQLIRFNSLVSKISNKVGNGSPLKKFVNNYKDYSGLYPKKKHW